jgi:hypothetical protein
MLFSLERKAGAAMCPNEVLVVVQREWNGWHKAFVRLRDLQNIHWLQPNGAPNPLVHAYVPCTSIVEGDLHMEEDAHHDWQGIAAPPILVCILKCHNTAPAYEEIVHRADQRNALNAECSRRVMLDLRWPPPAVEPARSIRSPRRR